MSAKTILYVEDNEMNRRIVRDLLKRTSYRLLEAPEGETGMTMARQERADLILMDVQLPVVSGIEATRTLRSEPATAETPIIAITSFALAGDEEKARKAGATAYLAKPYSPRDLLELNPTPPSGGPWSGGMKTIAWGIFVAALAISSGCVPTPDWIQRTLVTVDVTGRWYGRYFPPDAGVSGGGYEVWLDLQQEGLKVRGSVKMREYIRGGGKLNLSGPIDGTVGGDVFTFRQTDGSARGELTVSGDQMTGECSLATVRVPIVLRRDGSPPRPDPPR